MFTLYRIVQAETISQQPKKIITNQVSEAKKRHLQIQ